MDFKDTYRIFGDCPEETALHCNNHRILTEYLVFPSQIFEGCLEKRSL